LTFLLSALLFSLLFIFSSSLLASNLFSLLFILLSSFLSSPLSSLLFCLLFILLSSLLSSPFSSFFSLYFCPLSSPFSFFFSLSFCPLSSPLLSPLHPSPLSLHSTVGVFTAAVDRGRESAAHILELVMKTE
jgi:hypothetical protein